MNMIKAVKSAFGKYATFSGRALRSEFWWWQLFFILVSILLANLDSALFGMGDAVGQVSDAGLQASYNAGPLGSVWILGTLIPCITLGARRLHDGDRSGWWQLLFFVPILGWLVLLYWFIKSGTEGANRFGNHPLLADASVFG
jgi:uncharacterized membrane protein YhaH (DUF805 family)